MNFLFTQLLLRIHDTVAAAVRSIGLVTIFSSARCRFVRVLRFAQHYFAFKPIEFGVYFCFLLPESF